MGACHYASADLLGVLILDPGSLTFIILCDLWTSVPACSQPIRWQISFARGESLLRFTKSLTVSPESFYSETPHCSN